MKDLKKLLLGAAATTAAAGVLFAADASVAHAADAFVTPVDADGVPTSISGNPAVAQPEEKTVEDPNHSPYEYEAETKKAAIEIGEAMLKRSQLEGTALAQVNNHVDAVQTASGKWTPTFSYVEKAETPAKEDKKDEVKKDDKKKDESKKDDKNKDSKDKKDSEVNKDNKDSKAKKNESKKDDKKKSDKDSKVVVANEKAKKDHKAKKDAKAQKANAKLPATGVVAGSVAGLGVALVAAGSALSFRRRK
ncbi:LPXTG cell wall anchor domain-containing protein [Aerococcus tenax]|uniref:LPXTG cell wall anchor domain-containing protein n=1 Tax=Aerococcus tenax TaxID=3078812 RepID=UPI000DCCD21D|nr:LPXTG cell wall anchor domain-containing protein [Aerococcus tenax]WIW73739.1 LPXTG cell wall anchor domain-containing protein [Aerococcus tenax]